LEPLLEVGEVLDLHDVAVADHHVSLAGEDGGHERRDARGRVLVVSVGVDDHIGPELQAGVYACLERRGQALVVGQLDDVIDTVGPGHLDRGVAGTVVDDQPLDLVEAVEPPWKLGERGRELGLFVEAGDLDDQFHAEERLTVLA
jgi:hypothetical protein